MSLILVRLDDRLIHGQVVVGWGQALNADHFLLIDDQVSDNEWERELYRMGVPPEMAVEFVNLADAGPALDRRASDGSRTIVVVADVDTLVEACRSTKAIGEVNLGGIHEGPDRVRRLRYVFLTDDEAHKLEDLAGTGIVITAQDVPSAKAEPLSGFV